MNLKVRLAILYSLSVFIILVASATSIYILHENFRKEEFVKRLVLEASESFQIFTSQPEMTAQVAKELDDNAANSLQNERLFILNSSMRVIYSSQPSVSPDVSSRLLSLAKINQHYDFSEGKNESVILYRRYQDKPYYIIASASDVFGHRKNDNLKLLLIFSVLGGILFSGLIAFFYVKQAMKPLEELKNQIENITDKNLKHRITIPPNNNEAWQIAEKFNAMLDRLEQAFDQRKNFVQHASHELRTPLANMLSQTESALNKELSGEGYKNVLHSLKEDQQNLIDLTNSLLILSRYETITSVKDWTSIRIDEIIYQTVETLNVGSPEAVVSVNFGTVPENEEQLMFRGNESLIKSAIQNLLKNAVQYSENNRVDLSIDPGRTGIKIKFENTGKQLTNEEQSRLFIPFFRGENSIYKKGYGLGLSIVERILNIHNATITYEPVDNNINRFIVFLPHQ